MLSQTYDVKASRLTSLPIGGRWLLALGAGGLTPLSLAPVGWWPLALLAPTILALLLWRQPLRQNFVLSFGFGLGLFGVGASWVYVSIHEFGYAPVWLAALLTGLFVILLAVLFSLPLLLLSWMPGHLQRRLWTASLGGHLLAFCALWVIGEWIRSWLFTGFPWLYLGYSQWQTPLAGWAPVTGIYGLSLMLLASGAVIAYLLLGQRPVIKVVCAGALAAIWFGGAGLQTKPWTQPYQQSQTVALVQANIPQDRKWQPDFLQPTLERYQRLSEPAWDADWLIWPEAAIPLLYHQATPFLEAAEKRARHEQAALITGILYDDPRQRVYYNSAVGLGMASGIYHKTHLVPFGEYVPLENWLRGLIQFFNLPTSIITAGPRQQAGLQIGSYQLATAICYEIVYADLVADSARGSHAILTLSNDAWFGSSWGPLQHLEMARMRALETGRYVIRATNNGVSALIDPQGQLQQRSEQFVQTVVRGEVTPRQGSTPFMHWGSAPVIGLCLLAWVLSCWYGLRRGR